MMKVTLPLFPLPFNIKNYTMRSMTFFRVLFRSCSLKFRNIHKKTPVLESLFNKVVGREACNFIKKRLQHRCFPMNIAKFLRTPILKNIYKRLLLFVLI